MFEEHDDYDEPTKARIRGEVADRMWRELLESMPNAGLERIRGLLDVIAGRIEPELLPRQGARYRLFMPGLPSTAWLDRAPFAEIANELERLYPELRAEALAVSGTSVFRPYGQTTGEPDVTHTENPVGWDELRLWEDLRPTAEILNLPATAKAIRFALDRCKLLNHVAYLSMKPGTHLQAHVDRANWYVSIHMGIVVPKDSAIAVGGEARPWVEGKCIFFDNSFEHEAWNRGDTTRIIFAVYLPHPLVTTIEREALRRLHIRYQSLLSVGPHAAAAWGRGG